MVEAGIKINAAFPVSRFCVFLYDLGKTPILITGGDMFYRATLIALAVSALQACVTTSGSPFTIKTSGSLLGSSEGSLNVVSYAMTKEMRNYVSSAQVEELGQRVLSVNKDYEYTKWNDKNLGEMRMAPTSTFKKNGRKCRGYRVDYWFVGSLRVPRHIPAVACLGSDGRWVATD